MYGHTPPEALADGAHWSCCSTSFSSYIENEASCLAIANGILSLGQCLEGFNLVLCIDDQFQVYSASAQGQGSL